MSNQNTYTNVHAAFLQRWANPELKKLLGPKPTEQQLAAAVLMGNRAGKQTFALALAMRECGVTAPQIQLVCGAAQNNKRGDMIEAGYLKRIMVANDANNHTVYKVELTPRGRARCEAAAKREAVLEAEGNNVADAAKPAKGTAKAPAKAKGASKGKKATKVAAAETPISEPATAAEQASIEVPAVEPADETLTAQAAE